SIAAGLRRPDAGTAMVFGTDVAAAPTRAKASIGLAPQEIGIYPTVTVRDNLTLFGELAGLHGHDLDHRIDELAERLPRATLLRRAAGSLSGGERRRLHVGIATLHAPRLLLLDEPTNSLDVESQRSLLELVRSLAALGTAVCYSTNHLEEVERL